MPTTTVVCRNAAMCRYARAEIDRNRARVMELREFFAVNRRQVSELLYMSSKLLDEFEDGEA
jgi:hypothetical protein